jgi:hypothetical protein
MTAVDRRHKYLNELDSLISSTFLKACKQDEKTASDKKDQDLAKQIADAIGKARVLESSDWILSVEEPQAPTPPAPSEPSGGTPKPGTAPGAGPSSAAKEPGTPQSANPLVEQDLRNLRTILSKLKLERNITLKVPDPAASQDAPSVTNKEESGKSPTKPSGAPQNPKPKSPPKPSSGDEEKT